MKKLISLTLILTMLLALFSSCNQNTEKPSNTSTDEQTETNTSLETNRDTSTQTNTDTSTDSNDEQENESNLELNIIKDYGYYFEKITSTHYEVVKENIAQKREEHGKYRIIKSYDEYLAFLPENEEVKVRQDFFIDNYILVVYVLEEQGGFKKYRYDTNLFESKVLYRDYIYEQHQYVQDVSPDIIEYYLHLKIPVNMVDEKTDSSGKLTMEMSSISSYEYWAIDMSLHPEIELKENEAKFLSEEEKLSCIYPGDCAFIFNYHKEVNGLCAFQNFYVKDGVVYITMKRVLPYTGNSFGTSGNEINYYYGDYYYDKNDTYLVAFEESMLPYDMPQNPRFNITIIEYYR